MRLLYRKQFTEKEQAFQENGAARRKMINIRIPKNPFGFLFIVAVTLHRFELFGLSPSKIQMRNTG